MWTRGPVADVGDRAPLTGEAGRLRTCTGCGLKGERGRGVFDAPGLVTTLTVLRRAALLLTRALSLVGGGGGDEEGDWRVDWALKGDGGLGMLVGAFREGGLELELVARLSKMGLTVTCGRGGVDGEDGWDATTDLSLRGVHWTGEVVVRGCGQAHDAIIASS